MSAASGIPLSSELMDLFSSAVTSDNARFVKISIREERLVPDETISANFDSLEEDLPVLQSKLENDQPAYILARTAGQNSGWVAISYVPDTAKVREKMLYASTRNALTKSLGSTHFTDALFATTKADLTPEAYAAHKAHIAAPKPLSQRERELAEADRQSSGASYEGTRARRNHVNDGVGLKWSDEAISAIAELGQSESNHLTILSIDIPSETLHVLSSQDSEIKGVSIAIPSSEPSYSFYSWEHGVAGRQIVFIYSCPSSSSIKPRMLYSSGANAAFLNAKSLLVDTPVKLSSKRVETSDPKEIDEKFLSDGLGLNETTQGGAATSGTRTRLGEDTRAFARPKGPGRKR